MAFKGKGGGSVVSNNVLKGLQKIDCLGAVVQCVEFSP